MRGGFVACLGGDSKVLDAVAGRMRWHRGQPQRWRSARLEVAAFVDTIEGPALETRNGLTLVVHGAPAVPLAELQPQQRRFAALQWDGRCLRASRDPLGLAPLFYRVSLGAVWLSTEIHPLIAVDPPQPDLEALSAKAAFVPIDERTGWMGIARVLPGCTMEFTPDLRTSCARYWEPERLFGTYRGGREQALGEFRQRFKAAVKRCHEPGGAILMSGGRDSSAVALAAAPDAAHLVHVHYSALPQTHEELFAGAVADAVGETLHMVEGETGPWALDAELDTFGIPYDWLPYGMEEPALAHIAAQGITVALDGHDGDGVLGPTGSEWGSLILDGELGRFADLVGRHGVWRALRGIASDAVPPAWRAYRLRGFARAPSTYMRKVVRYFHEPLAGRLARSDIDRWQWPSTRWAIRQLRPLLPRATVSFEHKELEAARCGIDMRHPFADRDLVEFLISLPCAVKSDPERAKALLLDGFRDEFPEVLQARPKSDYMAVVRRRVDPAGCAEQIRNSNVRLAHLNYPRLFADAEADPESVPLFLLVNLTRLHEFVRRSR